MIKNTVINGLGRIGKAVLRAKFEENYDDINIVAINSSATTDRIIHQIKYDSIHIRFLRHVTDNRRSSLRLISH